MFTCVTDTGQLQWSNDDGDTRLYYSSSQVNETAVINFGGTFVLKLINANNNTFESTATVANVSLNNDGVNINCTSDINKPDHIQNSKKVFNNYRFDNSFKIMQIYWFFSAASSPSAPLSLTSSTILSLGFVTISWVAPLDTPLCVNNYTVTISNSSLTIVYNTTDTSLNITDLTSGNEYSATVAGRDGAGRLGQELSMQLLIPESNGLLIN